MDPDPPSTPPPTAAVFATRSRHHHLAHRNAIARTSPPARALRFQRDPLVRRGSSRYNRYDRNVDRSIATQSTSALGAARAPPSQDAAKQAAGQGTTSTGPAGSELVGAGGQPKTKPPPPFGARQRSLVPAAERRAQDTYTHWRAKKSGHEDEKWDITPDGGSGGREGRQFTVSNVGNNGRIYLKAKAHARPGHQRYPQPQFVFPMTPPGTAGLDALASRGPGNDNSLNLADGEWTPLDALTTPMTPRWKKLRQKAAQHRPARRRALSDSTIPESSVARESDAGGFKIVITQPGDELRPRTLGDLEATRPPMLEVNIPSYKLGTPRFSILGSPILRGSSYAPSEEMRSTSGSPHGRNPTNLTPDIPDNGLLSPGNVSLREESESPRATSLPRRSLPLRLAAPPAHEAVQPSLFDSLTFKPACDNKTIAKYSSTGAITAATPPRLVAEITSPSLLDYELLSDFFLTFRSFLEPADLLRLLVARLRWALARDDEVGLVVRVRTFVAMRHWILNYFMDDFVVDYHLRVTFCELLNDLVDDLTHDPTAQGVKLKILAELKKCWRRVCAQYWDGPGFDATLGYHQPILPGGIAGHRNPALDPTFWDRPDMGPPQLDGLFAAQPTYNQTSFYADVSRAGHIDSVVVGERPGTPEGQVHGHELEKLQASPQSLTSVDVVSCSLPTKSMRYPEPLAHHPLAAHPVDPSSVYGTIQDPIAPIPKALAGKHGRTQSSHKRTTSLTDSLRDHGTVTERVLFKNAEFLLTLPYAGSLVRGNLFPPGQAFVELSSAGGAKGTCRQTTIFQARPGNSPKERGTASGMSGAGMRKLLSGVRRALRNMGQGEASQTQTSFTIGPKGAATNRSPGTAIVPQSRSHQISGTRPPVRIDLLGAEIAEDFKKAVREDAAAEAERHEYPSPPGTASLAATGGFPMEYSAAHMGTTFGLSGNEDLEPRYGSGEMGITPGSQSIIIVDDTQLLEDCPAMAGAVQNHTASPSVESFAATMLARQGSDPTPPRTPPNQVTGTVPTTSSCVLSQDALRPTLSVDVFPTMVLGEDGSSTPGGRQPHAPSYLSQGTSRPSFESFTPHSASRSRLPLSSFRGHFRNPSARSYRSNFSARHRRYASFTSGTVPPTARSFDATTYSEDSAADASDLPVPVPPPLRVLRRRPGGDLRAAVNLGELDHVPLHRSRSVGSLTTVSDSMRSSFIRSPWHDSSGFINVAESESSSPVNRADAFSLGALVEQKPCRKDLSLFSTHSSKPIMRPSFEAEAQKLAQIPDDEDDGGIESALLKLEGKYEGRSGRLTLGSQDTNADASESSTAGMDRDVNKEEKREHRQVHVAQEPVTPPVSAAHDSEGAIADSPVVIQAHQLNIKEQHRRAVSPSPESTASFSSLPLLERVEAHDMKHKPAKSGAWTDRSTYLSEESAPSERQSLQDSEHSSYEFVKKTDSLEKVGAETAPPQTPRTITDHQSFLDLDSDENDSQLSSELSVEGDDSMPDELGIRAQGARLPAQLLGSKRTSALPGPSNVEPPSPPISQGHGAPLTPGNEGIPVLQSDQVWGEKPLPPTPEATPILAANPTSPGKLPLSPVDPTGTREALRNAPHMSTMSDPVARSSPDAALSRLSAHLPFILAFDSDVLAQQFTLIEKDALNEIDWKELIDMRWKNADQSVDSRSWVSFLRDSDARGVEVVIARFNIVVKWAVSEIVLTRDVEERARCLIKLIHTAAHCRRYRNYATMSQLTIALTSNEVARLSHTWAMVPPSDMRTLAELEELVSPRRNFYNLRAEMEGGGLIRAARKDGAGPTHGDDATTNDGAFIIMMGCIPFVGIYTHDLLFNAQRPSEIASSPTTPPLVNFERCRTAASVVKTLLRLLEASTLYDFQPVEGLTERCLWMGALTDEEIRRHGVGLE